MTAQMIGRCGLKNKLVFNIQRLKHCAVYRSRMTIKPEIKLWLEQNTPQYSVEYKRSTLYGKVPKHIIFDDDNDYALFVLTWR